MKVTSIDVYASNSNNVLSLTFKDPTSQNSYIATEILGLDADEITSKFYGSSSLSEDRYYELSLKKRDIILKIKLNPNLVSGESFSTLRDAIYKLIASSRTGAIELRFKNGLINVASISGFVTKVESPQFTKSPEIHLTINCNDPMLKGFELIDIDVELLNSTNTVITDDESTAPHGFQFGVLFSNTIDNFIIKDAITPTWTFEVDLTGSPLVEFIVGDQLNFSSEYNNRYLHLLRGVNTYQLIDRIVAGSIWPIIFPGDNLFVCSNFVTWEYIRYYPTYWGV